MNLGPSTLGELADRIAEADAASPDFPALAALVLDLERLAGAPLGGVAANEILLARRFARAHRILRAQDTICLADELISSRYPGAPLCLAC